MSRIRYILLFLVTLLVISSCKGVEDISFTGVDNVVFLGIEDNKVNFSADIGVRNPSSLAFRITEVDLKTSVDGIFIGTLTTTEPVKIRAKSDSSYHTKMSLNMASLVTGASTLYGLSRKKQVNVEMKGFVKARSWFNSRKVDVAENRLIDVPAFAR